MRAELEALLDNLTKLALAASWLGFLIEREVAQAPPFDQRGPALYALAA